MRTVALLPIFVATISCGHSIRVSGGALDRLKRSGDRFVLVFGSLSTTGGKNDRPAIRFLHPGIAGTTDTLLWSTVTTGQRFYAVLRASAETEYLDAFYVEAGAETSGFDRIIYANLRAGQEPLAMYVGEIEVRPAANRSGQGQKVTVETRDDFQNAQNELRRLYPRFDGSIVKLTPVRTSGPPGVR